jgi:hypothetical protein
MSFDEIDRSLLELPQKLQPYQKELRTKAGSKNHRQAPPARPHRLQPSSAVRACLPLLPANKQSDPEMRPAPPTCASGKQLCTSDEIAGIIMKSLRVIEDCPRRGFVVTVYGSNPWNAMLTIRPEAGPRIDRELWRSRVEDIGVRLRDEFDVADASTISTNGSA